MSRETIFRYECVICTNACFARGIPLNWAAAYIDPSENVSDWLYFCPKHAEVLIEQVPRKLLHPNTVIERGSFSHETAVDTSAAKPGFFETITEGFTAKKHSAPP